MSIKPEVSQALNSLLEEVRASDDARFIVLHPITSARQPPAKIPPTRGMRPSRQQNHVLYSWFSRDVINILKCKITEPLSFQLSLVIKHAKYIYF